MYGEAAAMYREAIARQTPPRLTDAEESLAQLCRLAGDWRGAMEAYRHILTILRDDWQLTEGETVRGYEENIAECRRRLGEA